MEFVRTHLSYILAGAGLLAAGLGAGTALLIHNHKRVADDRTPARRKRGNRPRKRQRRM